MKDMEKNTTALFINQHGADLIEYMERGVEGLPIRILTPPDGERDSLLAMAPDADVLIGWGSDMELLEAAGKMRLFINPGTGVIQHIQNFRALRETRDVVLINGHGNSYAVAQHTVAVLLSLANKVIPHHQRMVDKTPANDHHRTVYFKDITIGFLGYGAINKKVHRFLSGFDVDFTACRRSWDDDPGPFATSVEKFTTEQLSEFFEKSDVVINALPDTTFTKGMVTTKELALLGENGLFVNVGRGSTVVEEDIYKALKERVIAGAAIEVWWARRTDASGRSDPYGNPFHELDNLVMSPHRGADSGDDLARWDEVIENLKRVHAGRTDYLNVVDIELEY